METSLDYIEQFRNDGTLVVVHTTSSDNQCTRLIGKIDKVLDDSLVLEKGRYNEIIIFFDQIVAIREWTEGTTKK